MLIKNFCGHLSTISRHRHIVLVNCFRAGIIWRGLTHDLSKFSPTEFFQGVKYYQGTRSPNEQERETEGYSSAWMHHKGRNRHHFEYWTDYNPITKKIEPVKMPDTYIYEMFCDRLAASKNYNSKNYNDKMPLEYFLKGKKNRIIEKETSDKIEMLLKILADEGENAVFHYIKASKKKKWQNI